MSNNILLTILLSLIVFYALWGFAYSTTIYGSKSFQYVHLILVFILSLYYVGRHGLSILTNTGKVWAPYIVYSLAYLTYTLLFLSRNFILFIEYFVCLSLILIAARTPILYQIPVKFIMWSGLFAISGIAVQVFLPDFYYSRISSIFVSEDSILRWFEKDYGLSGFTSQIAITARIIIYGEIVLLFLKDILLPKKFQKSISFYLLLILFITGVLLTGKRLHFLVAASLPFIVPLLLERMSAKKIVMFLTIVLLLIFVGELFISNIENLIQTSMFRRLALTYTMFQNGEDITSGRIEFYKEAWDAFQDYPLFGIGLGEYSSYTGIEHYVHNTYLQVLCEQGLIGFFFFIIAIFLSIRKAIDLVRREEDKSILNYLKVSLGIQIFYILYCFTGNELSGTGLIMYFLSIALLVSVERLNIRKSY